MMQVVLIGVAAGAASALLFIASLVGSLVFSIATPLPILIAALGWSHLAGLTAALFAAASLAFIFTYTLFPIFLAAVGLPAWWLGYLALLARPIPNGGAVALEWYPIGRLLIWAAVLSSGVVALGILTITTDAETLRAMLRRAAEEGRPLVEQWLGVRVQLPRLIAEEPQLIVPPVFAATSTLFTVFSLWLAALAVRLSDRLRRPWPDLSAITFPPVASAMLAVALAGAFLLSGMAGIFATVLAAALLTAFGLLGLSIVHALTRGMNGRGLMLAAVYGAIVVFIVWPVLLLAMLGVADAAFDLRGRAAKRGPPPAADE